MLITAFFIFSIGSVIADNNPIVQTKNGKVRGESLKTFNNNNFYAFQGIPFAQPPVGNLRFQPPKPAKYWEGVLGSENSFKMCIQFRDRTIAPSETEDCLYLNVYTPKLPNGHENVSLPVLFYIHGGAFVGGSNHITKYRPHRLLDNDIVVVLPQYRLGFLGFVSTEDLECPGNNGFKDQQFAMRWVQENIHNFGGDPTRVTIAGESAGSASVGYQLLGSNAKGLFRGAIQSSGSSLGAWSLQRYPRGYAYSMANHINPLINEENTNTKELIEFFKAVEINALKKANAELFSEDVLESFLNTFKGYAFTGVIEPEHDGAFLTKFAYQQFESGNFNVVPTLISINSEESRVFLSDPEFDDTLVEYDASPDEIVTVDLHVTDKDMLRKIGNEIRSFYIEDGLWQDNPGFAMRMVSDAGFCKPAIKQAQLQAKYTDVYFFMFAYSGRLAHPFGPVEYLPGAETTFHGDGNRYIFPETLEYVQQYPELEMITVDRLTDIWTNFVKYLNPSPESSPVLQGVTWPKVSPNSLPYLLINETIEVKYDVKKSMMDAYSRIYDLYAVPPLDTY